MDVKSSRKSKGPSHQQHQHHQHGGRRPEANRSTKKKPHQNQHPTQAGHTQPALPSNWDRYEEEEEEEVDDSESRNPPPQPPRQETVVPKSKGADYSYLVSDAQSQSRGVLSFHEVLLQDFSQGLSSMLSARGKGFLSLGADDNFRVDDSSALDYEASFFSLDLHLLGAELAKLEPSKRLFVEDDILPASMRASAFKESINEGSENDEVSHASESERAQQSLADNLCFSEDTSLHKSEGMRISIRDTKEHDAIGQHRYDVSYGIIQGQNITQSPIKVPLLDQFDQILPAKDDASKSKELDDVSKSYKKLSTNKFEATAAEAELDMLLDSFGETKLMDSFDTKDNLAARFIGASASSSSRESLASSSSSAVGRAFWGLTDKVPNQMPQVKSGDLVSDELDEKMLPKAKSSIVNDGRKGGTIGNASSVSLDDFDEWLDSL